MNALIIPVFPIFNYVVNTDIYESLCINKDKPKMECHGKCHLSDELATDKSSENTKPILDINLKDYPIGFVKFIELDELIPKIQTFDSIYPLININRYVGNILHPPQSIV